MYFSGDAIHNQRRKNRRWIKTRIKVILLVILGLIPGNVTADSRIFYPYLAFQLQKGELPEGFCIAVPAQDSINVAHVMKTLEVDCGHRWLFDKSRVPYELGFYPAFWNPVTYDRNGSKYSEAVQTLLKYPHLAWDFNNEPDGHGLSPEKYADLANEWRTRYNATISCCSIILNEKPEDIQSAEYHERGLQFMEDFFAAGGTIDAISIHVYPMFSVGDKDYGSDLERANALWKVWQDWYKIHGRGLPVIVTEYSGSYDGIQGHKDMMDFMAEKLISGEIRAAFYYSARRYDSEYFNPPQAFHEDTWLFDLEENCNELCKYFIDVRRRLN